MLPTSLAGLPEHLPRAQSPPPIAPPSPPRVEDVPEEIVPEDPPPEAPVVDNPVVNTPRNRFGVFRRYTTIPRRDPEENLTLDAFADATTHLRAPVDPKDRNPLRGFGQTVLTSLQRAKDAAAQSYAPFLNWSTFKLMQWQYSGSNTKSGGEIQRLVDEVLTAEEFDKNSLIGFNFVREKRRLDEASSPDGVFSSDDGWNEASVTLHLPKEGVKNDCESDTPSFDVKNIWVRSLVEVIKAAFQDSIAQKYHWFPFHLMRARATPEDSTAPPERLFTDIYNSDAMLEAHKSVQAQDRNPDDTDDIEYVVGALLVYSDSTHLANFGTASLWPIYMFVGNLSKYLRVKPSMFAAHHLAYIPSVSDPYACDTCEANHPPPPSKLPSNLFRFYESLYGEPPSASVIRLLKHDLVQKIWLLLLDKDFMRAYEHGMIVLCGDGVTRRIFPRIFTYSADYPEK